MATWQLISLVPLIITTIGAAVFLQLLIKLVKYFRKYSEESIFYKKFPGPSPHWLFGNLKDVAYGKGIYRGIEYAEKYGPALTFYLGPFIRIILMNHANSIQTVLNTAEPKDYMYSILKPWIGDGLLLSKGKKWSRNRRLLTPAFHFDILKPYQLIFSESSGVMIAKWQKLLKENPNKSINMFEHVSLMTLDSLMKCIFGVNENFQAENTDNPYISAVYSLSELAMKRARFFPYHSDIIYFFSYSGYKFRKAVKVTHNYSKKVIAQKRAEMGFANGSRIKDKNFLDFLDILLECRDTDGKGLTLQEIQDEVDTFMFEGHDTTASGISWCLYNLARHPAYQEKCRQEVQNILGDRNEVTWDDLSKLTYLTMCIKESLRLKPPVPGIGRLLTKNLTLADGRIIPAGTVVFMSIYACHHNPNIWQNPEIYDPERFNPDGINERQTHAFIPFSAGPRNCIGKQFAMNELKTIVALVLNKFKLKPDGSKPADPLPELIMRSKGGLWLKLEEL